MSDQSLGGKGLFVAGGNLESTTQAYARRTARDELADQARVGQYCHALCTHQMGKSNLKVRAADRPHGERTGYIDGA